METLVSWELAVTADRLLCTELPNVCSLRSRCVHTGTMLACFEFHPEGFYRFDSFHDLYIWCKPVQLIFKLNSLRILPSVSGSGVYFEQNGSL